MRILRIILFPFSLLFGVITWVRNKLYDLKALPSIKYDDIFVVSVGNITVGGTGKTPFVEYLVREFSQIRHVAVISGGYKRKTKGFMLADENSTPSQIGDEPYQIKQKFPEIVVAVDVNRVRAIHKVREMFPNVELIILDDAFQYRKIVPNFSILLSDYNRPLYNDCILPAGRLREWTSFAKRADIMIITKTPENFDEQEKQQIEKRYKNIFPHQLFFSKIKYSNLVSVFQKCKTMIISDLYDYDVLLITGIAYPKPFEKYAIKHAKTVKTISFADHHAFSDKDIMLITNTFENISSTKKLVLTTEKDAVRLGQTNAEHLEIYYIPICVEVTDFNPTDVL